MKFPVVQKRNVYHPKVPRCPQCRRGKVMEPHSMAILSGSATFVRSRDLKVARANLAASLDIVWHGAHDSGGGKDRDIFTFVPLADECKDGEFEIYFCSTACLRAFLNSWVDALETKVRRERARQKRPKKQ